MESRKDIKGDKGTMARFIWLNHGLFTCKHGTSVFKGLVLRTIDLSVLTVSLKTVSCYFPYLFGTSPKYFSLCCNVSGLNVP